MHKLWTEQDIDYGRIVFSPSRQWVIGLCESNSTDDECHYCLVSDNFVVLYRLTRSEMVDKLNNGKFMKNPRTRNRRKFHVVN